MVAKAHRSFSKVHARPEGRIPPILPYSVICSLPNSGVSHFSSPLLTKLADGIIITLSLHFLPHSPFPAF